MSVSALHPSFAGIVRGESLKLSRQLSFWLSLAAAVLLLGVIVLAISGGIGFRSTLTADPTAWAYDKLEVFGTVFQIGSGIFLLVFGARLFGMEYSSGTIRILYARGAGRLQVLAAKMLTIAVVGVLLFAGYLVVVGAVLAVMAGTIAGNLDPIQHVSSGFWADVERWSMVQAISMAVAILIAAAASALGRSLAFAIAGALAYYPADNFLNILEILGIRATGHDQPWTAMSQYQLGPNLNVLLNLLEPTHRSRPAFAAPLAPVDATHALVVIGVYALVFAAIAVARTIRPDVLE
jgi:ABC-type transport system involved in multi-copper enzyme maturation permease subunit